MDVKAGVRHTKYVVTGLVLTAAIAGLALLLVPLLRGVYTAEALDPPDFVGIDMETAGNSATSLGTIETCNTSTAVGIGATITIDVVVDSIPAGDPTDNFQFALQYDPAVVTVTGLNNLMLINANGGTIPIDFSDPVPDSDGILAVAISDFGPNPESGQGVLSRITLTGSGTGVSNLSLLALIVNGSVSNTNLVTGATTVASAQVAVGRACPDPPTADPKVVATDEDTTVLVTMTGSDTGTCELTFAVESVVGGSLSTISDNPCAAGTPNTDSATVTFSPEANLCGAGAGSFTYTVTDDEPSTSSPATVTVDITCVNDPPVCTGTSVTTDEDTTSAAFSLNCTDVDSPTLTCSVVAQGAKGTVNITDCGSATYTPNADENGADSFTYKANDGTSDSANATGNVTINPVQDPPVCANTTQATAVNSPVTFPLPCTDADGDTLTCAKVSDPSNGTATVGPACGASATYTPATGFAGTDTFTFKANDGTADSNIATVTIDVIPPDTSDISVGLVKDEHLGDNNPPGDFVHTGLTASAPLSIVVTDGQVSTVVEVVVTLTGDSVCQPLLVAGPGDEVTVGPLPGGLQFSQLSFLTTMNAFEETTFVRNIEITCGLPGDYTLNVIADANAADIDGDGQPDVLDPNTNNNEAINSPLVTVSADADADTVETPTDNCPSTPNPDQADNDGDGQGDACDPDDDNDGIPDATDDCPLIAGPVNGCPDADGDGIADINDPCPNDAEDFDGADDGDGCPDSDVSVSVIKDESFRADLNVDVTKTLTITVQNGNHSADVRVTVLAVSSLGFCEVRLMDKPGDFLFEFSMDEDGDTVAETLFSQLERQEVGMAANETRVLQRDYIVHCFQAGQFTVELQVDVLPLPPVQEEFLVNNVHKNFPFIDASDFDGDTVADNVDNCPTVFNPGQEDGDADGVGNACDNCPNTPNADQANSDGDDWGNTCDNCPATPTLWFVPVGDDDCDGWTTADENFIGTNPNLACSFDNWPPDFNGDHVVDIFDVNALRPPVFGSTAPGPPYQTRFDLQPDGIIDIFDANSMRPPIFLATCSP